MQTLRAPQRSAAQRLSSNVERLEKTLARVAREEGVAQERLRRWVSFLALCGVLERAVQEGILNN